MKARALVLVLLASVGVACSAAEKDSQTVRRLLDRTEAAAHAYRTTEKADGRVIEATIRVEDSFQSYVTLTVDGVPLLEQIVVDDALALRLLTPDTWNPAAGTAVEGILGSGEWVVDPAGAPAVLVAGGERRGVLTGVGDDPLFDAQSAFEYARQAIDAAVIVQKFNPDSINYRPSEDPFRELVDDDERRGIDRYIAVPPPLPRTEEQLQRVPGPTPFRRLSVYARDGRLVRVLELIDFETHPELVKAKERREPKFLLELLRALRRGVGEEPIRPRSWSLEIVSQNEPVEIRLPSPSRTANLSDITTSGRLAQLPGGPGTGAAAGAEAGLP